MSDIVWHDDDDDDSTMTSMTMTSMTMTMTMINHTNGTDNEQTAGSTR